VPLMVRSSFNDTEGTWVKDEEDGMEQALISGVAYDESEAKVTIVDVPDKPGVAASIFRDIADDGVNVDMIVQNVSHDGQTDMSFTAPKADLPKLGELMTRVIADSGSARYEVDDGIAKVSLIGAGMKSHPGVAADMFEALAGEGINIEMISTSSIRISCVIRAADTEKAVQAIHAKFKLNGES